MALTVSKRMVYLVLLLVALSGCSALGVLSSLSGGPQVNTNAQVGQDNQQTLGQTNNQRLSNVQADRVEQSSGDTSVKSDKVDVVNINQQVPIWVWVLMILGWLLPSPNEIGRGLRSLVRNKEIKG